MIPSVMPPTVSKPLKHIELGKTLIGKEMYHDAFDHFKKSISSNPDCAIDILIYLYKQESIKKDPTQIRLTCAKIYIEIKNHVEAFDVFTDILDEYPNHEPTYEALGKLMVKKSLRSKIKQCFEFAIANDIYFPVIVDLLPTLYLEEKNYTMAIQFYKKMIRLQPNKYNHYKVLSELYFRKRDYESASNVLNQLLEIAPYKSDELIQPIQQIIQKIPRHALVRLLYADILFRSFKPIEACKEIETLVSFHPKKINQAILILKKQNDAFPQTPDILYLLAELMIQSELYTESLTYIQHLIQLSPIHSDKCLRLMQKIIAVYPKHVLALEIIGSVYIQQENSLQALHYFNQCIDECETPHEFSFISFIRAIHNNPLDPAQATGTLLLAKIDVLFERFESALSLIETLTHTSEAIEATLLQVSIYNKKKQSLAALPILKSLLSKHPAHWNVHADLNKTLNKYQSDTLTTLSRAKPSNDIQLQKGQLYLIQTNTRQAIDELQKINPESPEFILAQRMIARCFFEQSRFDLSNQILSRLITNTQDPHVVKECHYWKGLSHLLLSNDKDALHSFETIATYDQHYLHSAAMIKRLQVNKFLNHGGLVLVGAQTFLLSPKKIQLALRKNHFSNIKKKRHEFEVIGFAQSYNDEGCKQIIKQQFRAGEESFKLAIQMDPKFHTVYINYALLNTLENQPDDALEKLSLAEAITTRCPFLFYVKALCFIQKTDLELAINCIQKAIKLRPNEGLFYLTLGDLFYQQHQVEMADTYWKKASQNIEYFHWIQQRYRANHFDKICFDYWVSPEMLSLS